MQHLAAVGEPPLGERPLRERDGTGVDVDADTVRAGRRLQHCGELEP